MYLRIYVCMYVCMYVYMYVCVYVYMYVCYVCMYVRMYVVSMYVLMCVFNVFMVSTVHSRIARLWMTRSRTALTDGVLTDSVCSRTGLLGNYTEIYNPL